MRPTPLIPSERTTPKEARGRATPRAAAIGEAQYETIFNRLPQPTWILDRATLRFVAANEAATARYGYSREEFLAMSYPDLHLPEDAMGVRQRLGQYAPSRGTVAWYHRTKTEKVIRVHAVWIPVPFDRVPAILMVVETTPTALRRLVEETEEGRGRLEALSRRLVELQEAERSEIARELHDEIGQLLTGLKLLVASGERRGENGFLGLPAAERAEINSIVNELIGRLRDLSMNLRPPMLDEIGLIPTLEWYFGRYTARTHVNVTLRHSVEPARFPAAVEITAFRIIQEALTNVARHAGTDHVDVEIHGDRESLRLLIEDKGNGFNPRLMLSSHSAGICRM